MAPIRPRWSPASGRPVGRGSYQGLGLGGWLQAVLSPPPAEHGAAGAGGGGVGNQPIRGLAPFLALTRGAPRPAADHRRRNEASRPDAQSGGRRRGHLVISLHNALTTCPVRITLEWRVASPANRRQVRYRGG